MKQEQINDSQITMSMVEGDQCRVSYGDQAGGKYVIIPYTDAKPYIVGERPRSELVTLYGLAGNNTIMVTSGTNPAWSLHWPAHEWAELTAAEQSAIVGRQAELMTGEQP
jgi:hypothetical protein